MGMTVEADKRLAKLILSLPKNWQALMNALSFIGEPTVVLSTVLLAYISAAIRGQADVRNALFYAAIAFGVNILLKMVIRRSRPNNLDIEMFGIKSYSFPSGHAFGTVIFYGLFATLDARFLSAPWNLIIGGLVWFTVFMIGISRVYLKRHYPTDVLAGWLLGGVSLGIVYWLAF